MSYAQSLGIGADSVVTTGRVMNTEQEALAVAKLLERRRIRRGKAVTRTRILLVTSPFHRRRATRLFALAGLNVVPFPVDSLVREGGFRAIDLVPSTEALKRTELVLRELYGCTSSMLLTP